MFVISMTFCRNITWRKHSRCETFLKSLTLRNMDFVPLPFLVFVNMYSLAGTNIVSRVHEFSFWILWNPLLNQSIAVSPGFWQYSVWFHLLLCVQSWLCSCVCGGSVSSLAWFMSLQERSFVTLGQRVLAKPLKLVVFLFWFCILSAKQLKMMLFYL